MITDDKLIAIQAQIFEQHGIRTDVYYTEGKGVLVVREGDALIPQNIIATIPDFPRGFEVRFA